MICTVAGAASGCKKLPEPPHVFPVVFSVTDQDGLPLANVGVQVNARGLGTSDTAGLLKSSIHGSEGESKTVQLQCPSGFRSPATIEPLVLRVIRNLRQPAATQTTLTPIRYSVQCEATTHQGVLVVDTGEHTDLPVLVDGREVGRTNTKGILHSLLRMDTGTTFQVKIDTLTMPYLLPQAPTRNFTMPNHDDVFVWKQDFEFQPPAKERKHRGHRRTRHRTRKPKSSSHTMPVRLQ